MSFIQAPLRRLFRVVHGGTPTADTQNWDGAVAWATPVDLGRAGLYITTTDRTLTANGLAEGARLVPRGSILLSTRAPIGYLSICTRDMAFNQGCKALVSTRELDPRFFAYQLIAGRHILQMAGQGSTFLELTAEALGAFEVSVPSPREQRRIADFLDDQVARLDEAIALRGAQKALVRQRRASLLYDVISGADLHNRSKHGPIWARNIPQHWRNVKITYAARLGSGHTPSRNRPEWWVNCTVPWITTGEVAALRRDDVELVTQTRERLSHLGIENSSSMIHPRETVVLCRTAASAGYSGVMAEDMCTSQDFATWTCGPRLDPYWLLWCLRAMRSDLLDRLAMGSTHKTIYMPDIESLRIPLPPIEEQNTRVGLIRGAVTAAKDREWLIDQSVRLLQERKQALITAAVTGRLDVTTARPVGVA